MVFKTTYHNEEFQELSNELLGKRFSLIQKIKMNGVGSGRFIIHELSEKLRPQQIQFSELNYANIELRPNGIIVHFTNRLERFAWVIPYYKLAIFSDTFFSIHADGHFIKLLKNKNFEENKRFIHKMLNHKNKVINQLYDR